ncbi:YibE/F family protein [Luteococcus peritonei]|uniref:YibE/F family protein n=1 Tax=Luteococcus peritonei TaxID=88874 RepID=A0ABW4S0B6_9ACTN
MSHSHSHSSGPTSPQMERQERRALGLMISFLVPVAVFTLVVLAWLWPRDVSSHIRADSATVMVEGVTLPKATVARVNQTSCEGMTGSVANDSRACGKLTVQLDEGPESGQQKEVPVTAPVFASGIEPGDQVKLYRMASPQDGTVTYQFADFQRTVPLAFFAAVFAALVVLVARWRGFASLVGLVFACFVLGKFLFPALIVGHNPILVGLAASSAIMFVVLYAAHGFSTRTTTALVGTVFGLITSALLGWWATRWTHLTGVSSEDDFLLASAAPDLQLRSVVMCGVIVAGLGVLNDVTITQASAVWELAGTGRSRRDLFLGAMRIGRDHIASTVYTTAFATAGAILPILLLLTIYQRPLGETLTGEMFAAELVRTLVGSIGLVLAVPLTTAIAVVAVTAGPSRRRPDQLQASRRSTVEEARPVRAARAAQGEEEKKLARRRPASPDAAYRRPKRSDGA